MPETRVQFLDWEAPLEEGMATHSSILAWRIPMNRKAWWATVHRVAKSQTRLKPLTAAAAKSLQLCLTLCDPIDGSPPGSPVPGILQARTLEWVAKTRMQFMMQFTDPLGSQPAVLEVIYLKQFNY